LSFSPALPSPPSKTLRIGSMAMMSGVSRPKACSNGRNHLRQAGIVEKQTQLRGGDEIHPRCGQFDRPGV
jgi:hypothetical protein